MITFAELAPSVDDYLSLREAAGLGDRDARGAEIAVRNALFSCLILDDGRPVGMGRVLGDGGAFAIVTDVALLPEYHGKGLGRELMRRLVAWCHQTLPPKCHISLICQPEMADFYGRFGFREITGMEQYVA